MHSSTWFNRISALALAASLVAEVAAGASGPHGNAEGVVHRRHHARKSTGHRHRRRSSTCSGPVVSGSSGGETSSSSSSSSDTVGSHSHSNSTSAGSDSAFSSQLLQKGGVAVGFLNDDGDAGGQFTSMATLNSQIGAKSATYGYYAQAHSGTPFTGQQLLSVMDDVKACKCVFQPAVMPTGGWQGLTSGDNSQAQNICKVMKKFTDQGIEVWLRFAHEMNWYQQDGTYQGNAADFKAGWAAVASACKEIAPEVKMFWTPNVASMASYASYEPDDMGTVDYVGVDFYPQNVNDNTFISTMQAFHDKYAVNGRKFAIGETGLGFAGDVSQRIAWLKQVINSKSTLKQLVAVSWFNYQKGYDFKVAGEPDANSQFKQLMAIS